MADILTQLTDLATSPPHKKSNRFSFIIAPLQPTRDVDSYEREMDNYLSSPSIPEDTKQLKY